MAGVERTDRAGGSLAVLLVSGLLICGAAPPLPTQEHPGDVNNGRTLYEQHCLKCHGAGGWGDGPQARYQMVGPTNFHSTLSRKKSDEELLRVIEHGVVFSPMHSWRGTLRWQEMQDVLAYIRLLSQRIR